MLVHVVFVMAVVAASEWQAQADAFSTCPNYPGCLSPPSVYCDLTGRGAPDTQCCPGATCVPYSFPGSSRQPPRANISICVDDSEAEAGRAKRAQGAQGRLAGLLQGRLAGPLPPILPQTWHAKATYTNVTNNATGTAEFWFDGNIEAIRTDFAPFCPFLELFGLGLEANYVPCSVVFVGAGVWPSAGAPAVNAYAYPSHNTTCAYPFPAWKNDFLCSANASYGGTFDINGVASDLWRVEWATHFAHTPYVLNIRNLYVAAGTNIPTRFREDLDTGFLDFHSVDTSPIDVSVFTSVLDAYPVYNSKPECVHYPAMVDPLTWPTGFLPAA